MPATSASSASGSRAPRAVRLRCLLPPNRTGVLIALIPLIATVAFGLMFFINRPAYLWAVAEDSAVEWATMATYVLIAPFAFLVALRRHKGGDRLGAFAWLVLTIGFLFIAGEEVSWFQRQIGFDGPEALVAANIQQEANLHNLLGRYALHGAYITVGLWGLGLGRVLARALPIARPVWLYAPGTRRWTWFFPVTAFYIWIDYIGPGIASVVGPWFDQFARGPARLQEAMELLLAIGFATFVFDVFRSTAKPSRELPIKPQRPDELLTHERAVRRHVDEASLRASRSTSRKPL